MATVQTEATGIEITIDLWSYSIGANSLHELTGSVPTKILMSVHHRTTSLMPDKIFKMQRVVVDVAQTSMNCKSKYISLNKSNMRIFIKVSHYIEPQHVSTCASIATVFIAWSCYCSINSLQGRHNGRGGAYQRKHKMSASLAFVWGIHRWPVNARTNGQ